MPHSFGSLTFTSAIKALQERHGSRRHYERAEKLSQPHDRLGAQESAFIAERDSFYMATIGSTGWPYIQHRGGPPGFVKVIDDQTLAFADYRGNKQYISAGNLATEARVAIIMVDYPNRERLKLLGHAETLEAQEAMAWLERVRVAGYAAAIERVFMIHVDAFDWNCSQHITPRYNAEEIQDVLEPTITSIRDLERQLVELRKVTSVRSDAESKPEGK